MVTRQQACPDYDPETHECMRRFHRCDCNPPRCICGRFVREWGEMHPECHERMHEEEERDLRQSVNEQGMVGW